MRHEVTVSVTLSVTDDVRIFVIRTQRLLVIVLVTAQHIVLLSSILRSIFSFPIEIQKVYIFMDINCTFLQELTCLVGSCDIFHPLRVTSV